MGQAERRQEYFNLVNSGVSSSEALSHVNAKYGASPREADARSNPVAQAPGQPFTQGNSESVVEQRRNEYFKMVNSGVSSKDALSVVNRKYGTLDEAKAGGKLSTTPDTTPKTTPVIDTLDPRGRSVSFGLRSATKHAVRDRNNAVAESLLEAGVPAWRVNALFNSSYEQARDEQQNSVLQRSKEIKGVRDAAARDKEWQQTYGIDPTDNAGLRIAYSEAQTKANEARENLASIRSAPMGNNYNAQANREAAIASLEETIEAEQARADAIKERLSANGESAPEVSQNRFFDTILGALGRQAGSHVGTQRLLYEAGEGARVYDSAAYEDAVRKIENSERAYAEYVADYGADSDWAKLEKLTLDSLHLMYDDMIAAYESDAQGRATKATSDMANALIEQGNARTEAAKAGLGKVGQFAVDLGGLATDLAFDAATGRVGGAALSSANMANRVFGSRAQEAEAAGATVGQQLGAATADAVKAVGLNKIVDGVAGVFGKGAADDIAERVIAKLSSTDAGRNALRAAYRIGGEALEETVDALTDPVVERIYNDAALQNAYGDWDSTKETLAEALYQGVLAAVLSAGTQGFDYVRGGYDRANTELRRTEPTEEAAPTAAETAQKPTVTQPEQAAISPAAQAILSKDSLSNNDVRRILDDALLRAEIESVIGSPIPADNSSASNQRTAVKEYFNAYKNQSNENATQRTQDPIDAPISPQAENASTGNSQGLNSVDAVTEVNSQNLGQGTARPQVEGGDLVRTQTHGSDSLYTDAERREDGLRPEDSVHERHTDAAVDAVVEQRYQADRDGEKAYLFESGERWTDADTALAHRLLSDAVEEARKTGDYSEVVRLQREWERQGTTEGQALRQRGRFVESPEHIVAEAAEALSGDGARKNLTPTERNSIIGQVDQLAHEAASIAEGDTASVIEMIKQLNEVRRTTGLLSEKTGRGLSRALEQAAKLPDGYAFLKSVLNAQIRGVANDYTSPGVVNVIQTIRNQNMLSNFSTIVRNLAANNILDPLEAWSTNQGVLLDMALSKLTGTRSTAFDLSWFSKAKRKGTGEGFVKSYIQEALDANIENATGKYEGRAGRTFKMTGNMVERVLSTWQKYLNYGLKTTDEAQKGGIRAETQRGIDRLKERGLLAEDAMQNRAEEVALDRTLQTDGAAARLTTGVRNALDVIGVEDSQGNRIGAGSIVLPFAKVPANATAKIVQYTPVGVIETGVEVTKALIEAKRGTLTPERQARIVQSVGRNATAVELVTLFTYAALTGALTVGGDDDKDKEASERSQGKRGTQLNLSALHRALTGKEADDDGKDIVLDLAFAEVLNANMAMGAAIAEAYKEDGEISVGDILEANASSAFQAIIDFPALQQFGSIVDDYNYSTGETEGEKLADVAVGFMGNAASSFLVPNIVRGVAKGTDPYVRDVYGGETQLQQQIDNIKSGIPFLRETLPIAKDSWGNDRTYTGNGSLDFINATINPGTVSYVTKDPVLDELSRLSDAGISGLYPDRSAPRELKVGGDTFPLTQEDRAWYMERAGSLIKEYYTGMQNSSAWNKLKTDEQKGEALKQLKQIAYARVDEEFLSGRAATPNKMSASDRVIASLESPYDYVAERIVGREADALLSNNKKMSAEQYQKFRSVADERAELLLNQFTGSDAYGHMSAEQRTDVLDDLFSIANAYGKKAVDKNAKSDYDTAMKLSDPVSYVVGLSAMEDYQKKKGGTFSKSDPDVFKAFIDMGMPNKDLSVLSGNMSDAQKRTYDVMTEMLGQDMANTIFVGVNTQSETGSNVADRVKASQISQIPDLTDEQKMAALEAYVPADSETGKRASVVRQYEAAAQNGIPFDLWTSIVENAWAANDEGVSNKNNNLDKKEIQEGAKRAGYGGWQIARNILNGSSDFLTNEQIYDESAKKEKEPKTDNSFKRGEMGYLYEIAPWLRP